MREDGMKRRPPWWWWTALLSTSALLIGIAASFAWVFGWTDSGCRYYVYLEHGLICGNPNRRPPGFPVTLPWYGHFEVYRSGMYTPWRLFPDIDLSGPGAVAFRIPVHLLLGVSVPMLAVPLLKRYLHRESGSCTKCGYDLTGNVSGVCPECGEAA
jgi:hypothetical protein